MKIFALIGALALGLPGVADARKVTYYSDRDGDGHAVKRTANVPDYHGGSRYGGGYGRGHYGRGGYGYGGGYGGSYYGGHRSRYRSPYYGYGGGYGGYGGGYGYGYPSYYRSAPAVSLSYTSSSPRYYRSSSNYRSSSDYRSHSSSLEVDVQRVLKRRGYYYGPIDGDVGPGTREAIRSFQADRGLRVTGRIDSSLLRSLGV